jgi:hypothetical protein
MPHSSDIVMNFSWITKRLDELFQFRGYQEFSGSSTSEKYCLFQVNLFIVGP